MVAAYLQSAGFKIVPVYPKEEFILGEKFIERFLKYLLKLIWWIF